MKRTVTTAIACLALAASAIPQAANAARFHDREAFMGDWCSRHPGDSDCYDWHHHRDHWNDARYHEWYGHHEHDFGPADTAAALFGFAAGTAAGIVTGALNGGAAPACMSYHSYDSATHTYIRHGVRHSCP